MSKDKITKLENLTHKTMVDVFVQFEEKYDWETLCSVFLRYQKEHHNKDKRKIIDEKEGGS